MHNFSVTESQPHSPPSALPAFRGERARPGPQVALLAPDAEPALDSVTLAEQLAELAKDGGVEHAVEIGRLVIGQLYGGDLSTWRSRGPKAHSLRELARRDDLPVSSSALYRAIALYELSERLGGIESWTASGLGISHMRLVLGLPQDEQRRLLDAAVRESWTVAELEREAVGIRDCQPGQKARGGRPRLPRFVKSLNRLSKCASSRDELFGDLEAATQMAPCQLADLRAQLAEVRGRCEELERALAAAAQS